MPTNDITHPFKVRSKKAPLPDDNKWSRLINNSYKPDSSLLPISNYIYNLVVTQAKRTKNKYPNLTLHRTIYTKGCYILDSLNKSDYLSCIDVEDQVKYHKSHLNLDSVRRIDKKIATLIIKNCLWALSLKRGYSSSKSLSIVVNGAKKYGIKDQDIQGSSKYFSFTSSLKPTGVIAYFRTGREGSGHSGLALLMRDQYQDDEYETHTVWRVKRWHHLMIRSNDRVNKPFFKTHISDPINTAIGKDIGDIVDLEPSNMDKDFKNVWLRCYPVDLASADNVFEMLDRRGAHLYDQVSQLVGRKLKDENKKELPKDSSINDYIKSRRDEIENKYVKYNQVKWNCHNYAVFALAFFGISDPYLYTGFKPRSTGGLQQAAFFRDGNDLNENSYSKYENYSYYQMSNYEMGKEWIVKFHDVSSIEEWKKQEVKNKKNKTFSKTIFETERDRREKERVTKNDLDIVFTEPTLSHKFSYYDIAKREIKRGSIKRSDVMIKSIILAIFSDYIKSNNFLKLHWRAHSDVAESFIKKFSSRKATAANYFDCISLSWAQRGSRFNTRNGGGSYARRLAFCSSLPRYLPAILQDLGYRDKEIDIALSGINKYQKGPVDKV
ncbi:hypothetical protein M9194_07360 [Vibrio sp. S4M6]|uniref:hypothetical protein n=1 Tax=Vibrio sinus TaxID=2946865 RepID=UPI00202A5593|nr:hypothetical protein [Vibrio sinus]MCL9781244.1 hypothetical protein [Vibrio sinus]